MIDAPYTSGLDHFRDIPEQTEAFYKQQRVQTGTHMELVYDNLDTIMEWTVDVALYFLTKLAKDPWLFGERYMGHVVVHMNTCVLVFQKMPEWLPMASAGQCAHRFVVLLQEVSTALPSGETLDWLGCQSISDQVLEFTHIGMVDIEPRCTLLQKT